MKTHGVCTLGEVLLGLLISLSFQKLDVTAEMFFNLKYCTPIISGLGGLKLNLVVGVNCLSLEPSLAGDVTVQRLHNLPFGKSCPWQPCYSCSTSASSTCTQCCWDEEDSYLWLFLHCLLLWGVACSGSVTLWQPRRGACIIAHSLGTRRDLLSLWPCYPSPFCSFLALSGPPEPFCSTFWFPWLDCTLPVQGLSDVILPLFILVAIETLVHSPKCWCSYWLYFLCFSFLGLFS